MRPVWYVYYGTRGAAGQYIHALQSACREAGVKSRAFVSARYRFRTWGVVRWFFPITDRTERRNVLLKALRGIELAAGYGLLLCGAAVIRPRINLSLIDDFILTYWFFRGCKVLGLRVDLTCHDVVSHQGGGKTRRFAMMQAADGLVVHSPSARRTLLKRLGTDAENRIVEHGFPWGTLSDVASPADIERAKAMLRELIGKNGTYFLFVGVIRRSKGIDTLLDAWEECAARKKFKLLIAGKWDDPPPETHERARNLEGCVLLDRYLTDEEFVALIENARFVVLPYLDYTHSSVFLSCAARNAPVMISDAPLFAELLPDYDLTSARGNAADLATVMDRAASMGEQERRKRADQLSEAYQQMQHKLVDGVRETYGAEP